MQSVSNKIPKAWLEWNTPKTAKGGRRITIKQTQEYRRSEGAVYKSAEMGYNIPMKKEKQVYTGTLVKGLATMHKSNLVPVIDQEQAIDIANMRRN